MTITFFDISVPGLIDGRWQQIRKTGMAEILDRGFQMQLGDNGYCLRVTDSAHYATDTIIYAYSHSCGQAQR